MKREIRAEQFVIWTLPLAARLHQRTVGPPYRVAALVNLGKGSTRATLFTSLKKAVQSVAGRCGRLN